MADLNAALAELNEWADEAAHPQSTDNTQNAHIGEEEPCLSQHQIRALQRLAQSIKGAPLPAELLPPIPR
ncbi:hypothetical protein [Marinobacter subterrani]|uniref:hypothetical protein n=1 Tax=Marinobacter subterrani TaxID=1658765 RepID=UPI00235319D3|nr:hypothetical protein [Marinobacter subterrani]